MKKQKLVRLLALVIAIVMSAAVFAGCAGETQQSSEPDSSKAESKDESKDESSTADDGNVAAPSGIPTILKEDPADMHWMHHVDEAVTLDVYVNAMSTDDWNWGDDATTQYITERTGISLNMRYAPDSEGTEINLMLAGGDELPDIFQQIAPNTTIAGELIKGKYVACAEDLINEIAPEFWDLYTPFQKDYATNTDDGKMWGFVNGYEFDGENHYGYMHGYIAGREDILEELGTSNLDIKTVDDLMNVLDEFNEVWKTDYPDIIYPVLMRGVCGQFSAIYGQVACNSDIRYDADNDSCYFWFQSEAGKNTLKLYNELYRKGYLPEEAFISTDSSIDIMGAGKALFYIEGNVWQSSSANAPLKENVGPDAWMMPLYPLSGAGEETLRTFKGITYNGSACWISADSENQSRALDFIEYMTTEEGILTTNCGIYGTHWDVATDSDGYLYPEFIDEVYDNAVAEGQNGQLAMKEAYGINNYEHMLWFYHTISYNFLWNYDTGMVRTDNPANLLKARNLWYSNTTDNADLAGVPATLQVDTASDCGVALAALSDIYGSELAKIVFTNSDAEFEAKYQGMLDAMQAAGEENFWTLYKPLIDAKLELYKEALAAK